MRIRLIRSGVGALVSIVVFVLSTAPAGAVTFGADLSAPADANAPTCAVLGQSSCLGFSMIPTSYAPVSAGTVTAVRVRTADVPQGPMQVVVMRSYYQNNPNSPGTPNDFCCFVQAYGPVFTPAPGAITTVPTDLPMIEQPVPASGDFHTVAAADFLALSVLSPSTPVPLAFVPGSEDLAFYYAPAPLSSLEPAPSANGIPGSQGAGTAGFELLLNADIVPAGTGGGAVPVADTGPGALQNGSAQVPLICQLTTACTGTLTLEPEANARARARSASATSKVLGTTQFSIPAQRSQRIKVMLNAAGRRFVQNRKTVTLAGLVRTAGRTLTLRVTLRRSA